MRRAAARVDQVVAGPAGELALARRQIQPQRPAVAAMARVVDRGAGEEPPLAAVVRPYGLERDGEADLVAIGRVCQVEDGPDVPPLQPELGRAVDLAGARVAPAD